MTSASLTASANTEAPVGRNQTRRCEVQPMRTGEKDTSSGHTPRFDLAASAA
jgi:hypothetical protein